MTRTCDRSARCIATFSPFVITVSESSFSDLICFAISAVVVPESRMMVSARRISASRGVADAQFLAMVQRLLDCDPDVALIEALQRTAVRPHQRAALGECVEVAANGHRRHVEPLDQILDGDAIFLVEQVENAPASFFDEQLRRFPVRDFDHDYAHLEFDRGSRLLAGQCRAMQRGGKTTLELLGARNGLPSELCRPRPCRAEAG